jgi:periplasmic protein TonB
MREPDRVSADLGRSPVFLLVVALHAGLLTLLLVPQLRERIPVPTLSIQVQVIESTPHKEAAAPLPQLTLERPHIDTITPEVRIDASSPETPSVVQSATSVAVAPPPSATSSAIPAEPVTPPRVDVAYLKNPAPVYPSASARLREQGTALLKVLVSSQGAAIEVAIERSSGSPRLDEAALQAVRRWRFVSARRGSEAVEAWVLVPVEFELQR